MLPSRYPLLHFNAKRWLTATRLRRTPFFPVMQPVAELFAFHCEGVFGGQAGNPIWGADRSWDAPNGDREAEALAASLTLPLGLLLIPNPFPFSSFQASQRSHGVQPCSLSPWAPPHCKKSLLQACSVPGAASQLTLPSHSQNN